MKKWIILILAVLLHAFLTFFSFAWCFAAANMVPEEVPRVSTYISGYALMVTWQPLLFPVYLHHGGAVIQQFVNTHFYLCILVNSIVAVGLGYLAFLGIRRLYRKHQQTKTVSP